MPRICIFNACVPLPKSFTDITAVSESGIKSHAEIEKLRAAGFDAFLIGTSLMLAPDPAAALSALLGGQS